MFSMLFFSVFPTIVSPTSLYYVLICVGSGSGKLKGVCRSVVTA